MGLIGAIILFPYGVALGTLLVANFIGVLGWAIFSLAPLAVLPPPLAQIVQGVLAFGLISWLWLLLTFAFTVAFVFVLYWVASLGTPVPPAPAGLVGGAVNPTLTEALYRGALAGFNAGLNTVFLLSVLGIGPGAAFVVLVLAGIPFLACLPPISNNRFYQVVLAYVSLFLPMTLPINLVGWLVAGINGIAAGFGVPVALIPEWTRANFVMHGGIVQGCIRTAFNLCNFTVAHGDMRVSSPWIETFLPVWPFCPALGFAAPAAPLSVIRFGTVNGVVLHEASHTLNVGAFGWIFHVIGFADEFAPMPWSGGVVLGANAYAELCAESGRRSATTNWLGIWAPSTAAAAVVNAPAVASVTLTPSAGVVALNPTTVLETVPSPAGLPATAFIPVPAFRTACETNRGVTLTSSGPLDVDGPTASGLLWDILTPPAPPAPPAAGLMLVPAPPIAATIPAAIENTSPLTFTPNMGGRWVLRLSVTDGADGITPGGTINFSLGIVIDVLAGSVTAPAPASLLPNTAVVLTAAATAIPAPDAAPVVNFTWTLVSAPAGSALTPGVLGNAATLTFTPDVAGPDPAAPAAPLPAYVIDLVVTQDVSPAGGGPNVALSDTVRVTLT